MIFWVFQHQTEAEAMMSYVLGVHGDLIEDIPELGFVDVFHHHHPATAGRKREGTNVEISKFKNKNL